VPLDEAGVLLDGPPESIGDSPPAHHRGKRRVAAAEPFPEADDIGHHAESVGCEKLPGAPHARDDLVENEEHPIPIADFAENRQIFLRRVDDAARVSDGLHNDRGHGGGILHFDHVFHNGGASDTAVGILLAEGAAVARRRKDVQEAGRERLVDGPPPLQPRRRQRAERGAVPGEVPADDFVPPRLAAQPVVLPRELDRRLGHLRAAALELDGRQVARRKIGQDVGELHRHGVRPVHGRREGELIELAPDRFNDAAVVVADGDDVDPGQSIEVTLAVHVPVVHAVRFRHDERVLRPLLHLVADENLSEKCLLRRPGVRQESCGETGWGCHVRLAPPSSPQ
jgi:hypothetical protein